MRHDFLVSGRIGSRRRPLREAKTPLGIQIRPVFQVVLSMNDSSSSSSSCCCCCSSSSSSSHVLSIALYCNTKRIIIRGRGQGAGSRVAGLAGCWLLLLLLLPPPHLALILGG